MELQFLAFQKIVNLIGMHVTYRHKILFVLVLYHRGQQVIDFTCRTEEYLTLAILYIFLNVQGNGFRDAEVLHVFRDGHTHLLAEMKEMVDGMTRSKYNGCMLKYFYLL